METKVSEGGYQESARRRHGGLFLFWPISPMWTKQTSLRTGQIYYHWSKSPLRRGLCGGGSLCLGCGCMQDHRTRAHSGAHTSPWKSASSSQLHSSPRSRRSRLREPGAEPLHSSLEEIGCGRVLLALVAGAWNNGPLHSLSSPTQPGSQPGLVFSYLSWDT